MSHRVRLRLRLRVDLRLNRELGKCCLIVIDRYRSLVRALLVRLGTFVLHSRRFDIALIPRRMFQVCGELGIVLPDVREDFIYHHRSVRCLPIILRLGLLHRRFVVCLVRCLLFFNCLALLRFDNCPLPVFLVLLHHVRLAADTSFGTDSHWVEETRVPDVLVLSLQRWNAALSVGRVVRMKSRPVLV